jgi:hypothetical protein
MQKLVIFGIAQRLGIQIYDVAIPIYMASPDDSGSNCFSAFVVRNSIVFLLQTCLISLDLSFLVSFVFIGRITPPRLVGLLP